MATQLRERNRVSDFANYEQQMPDRDMNFRSVDVQPGYQEGYDDRYTQGYVESRMDYQPQGFFQSQASHYINSGFNANGFNAPQYGNYNYTYTNNSQELYQQDVQFAHVNRINPICEKEAWTKKYGITSVAKKSINKDMIKIIVTVMVIALAICSLLIANQFISVNQAQAEEDVQNIDSDLLASSAAEDGSYVATDVTIIPAYEYEQSTNWFDKFCDSLGIKLK